MGEARRACMASQTKEARGIGVKGGAGVVVKGSSGGKHGKSIKGATEYAGTVGSAVAKRSTQSTGQKGRRFGEAGTEAVHYIRSLESQNQSLREKNAQLSAQLRVRTTTDRARNLLRESRIPAKMQPDVLRLMVGKREDEMQAVIRYHERLIETAVRESVGYDGDTFDTGVEGAGSRFRESRFSGGDNVTTVLDGLGLPLKE